MRWRTVATKGFRLKEQHKEYAVEKNTVIAGGMGELGLGIEGILRRAARSLIEQAIE
ncbi:IS256 family transposase, partial [Acidithiobacillus sp. HP-11]|nr:IS256 family transposase [Acidithiobacillus sp. HP-11]